MNIDAPLPGVHEARARVLGIQTKLHRWATDDPHRRFDDLFNLVVDPAFLLLAWHRVRGNKGARSAGVDGQTARTIEAGRGVDAFLTDLRHELKAGRFTPPVVSGCVWISPGSGAISRGCWATVISPRSLPAVVRVRHRPTWSG